MSLATPWPHERAAELSARFKAFAAKPQPSWTFVMSDGNDVLNYIQPETREDMAALPGYTFVEPQTPEQWAALDLVLVTTHGSNLAAFIFRLKAKAPQAVIALWLWDNHVAHLNNLHTVLGADIYFPSHAYASPYLANPACLNGGHVPACSAQWSKAHAASLFGEHAEPRSGKMLMNYVDYQWSWRSELLQRVRAEVPEAQMVTMPSGDRSRYFAKPSAERFREWLGHKCTLILPLDSDLSTRVFDALLAGMVPVVPTRVVDFDAVFAPALQQALGIVRTADFETATLRAAAREAEALFDRMGVEGVQRRHRHALQHHTIANRCDAMLNACRQAGGEQFRIVFGAIGNQQPGQHVIHAATA
ncbi:MAG TPA: hypothetical protein VLA16_10020 [Ideonella sp.]|nr:hypothetical protein [Ideonella sp.]